MMPLLWLLPALCYALGVGWLAQALAGARTADRGSGPGSPPAGAFPPESPPALSVILALRNEEALIASTLAGLRAQGLASDRLQVLAVDDGSTDHTGAILAAQALVPGLELCVLATAPEARGKKRAILLALERARHPVIAVLDGDTAVGPRWAESVLAAFDGHTGLVASPALLAARPHQTDHPDNAGLFQRLLRLEYCGLLGAGLAGFDRGRPLFASGTNLAWRRTAFEQAGGFTGVEDLPSGDDTLLIQRLATRTDWLLKTCWEESARVWTRGPLSWAGLLRQRARWVSTGGHYPDRMGQLAGLVVYTVFLQVALAPALALAGLLPWAIALATILLKLLPDALLVGRAARRMGQQHLLPLFPLAWLAQLGWGLLLPWLARRSLARWRS